MRLFFQHLATFRGSSSARWVLRLLGWHRDFEGFPVRLGVAVFYPHSSNSDFPLWMLAKWAMGAQVPLALDKLGWVRRRFCVVDFYDLTEHVEQDHTLMAQAHAGVTGFMCTRWGPSSRGVSFRPTTRSRQRQRPFPEIFLRLSPP